MEKTIRPLLVFAGQSNMMGAAVYPPRDLFSFADSYEYLHKPRRFGKKQGLFKKEAFPVGEFSYCDLEEAYPEKQDDQRKSTLIGYASKAYFCPAMSNLADGTAKTTASFASYSEADFTSAPSLAPYLVRDWENRGHACAYTHIAKGSVSIEYYLNPEMLSRFDGEAELLNAPSRHPVRAPMAGASGHYFEEKVRDFFADSEARFPEDDVSLRALLWLQGESDAGRSKEEYLLALRLLWEQARQLGFTHFFCIRCGYWNNEEIVKVLQAQEAFCRENPQAHMLTRIGSYFPIPGRDERHWFAQDLPAEYSGCRDSFYGFSNNHYNQKGFELIAKACVPNMERILLEGLPAVLEPEMVLPMGG